MRNIPSPNTTLHSLSPGAQAIYAPINQKGNMRRQLSLNLYRGQRGGIRPGAGRKRLRSKGVAHRIREKVTSRTALHYVLFNQQKHSGMKKVYVDSFSSLGAIKDFKSLAKAAKMTVILSKIEEINFLTPHQGWMLKQVLNQQIG